MASTYNPYSDIQNVYNAKVAWNQATTDEERKRQNEIATAARKNLEAYGYSDIANQISASGADATVARKIMEKYAPTVTDTNTSTKSTVETNNLKSNEINRENAGLFDKLNDTYNSLTKTNPFTTAEAKAILGKYDLAGLQARDNAVASGGASNGGNIDSYASANAMRQQASLINQGQMAVLDAHQQKIDNVRGLLSDMGVNIDRVFTQDETAKNNDVARKSEIASVTGEVPIEWTYSNNIYLNSDGTVREEYLTEEFDNTGGFTTIINNAKAKLATTTDATERAILEATIRSATQAKALKTYSSPKYAKYAHEVQGTAAKPTEVARQFNEQIAATDRALNTEKDTTLALADKESASAINQINAEVQGQKDLMKYQAEVSGGANQTLSDDAVKVANIVMDNINKLAEDRYNTKVVSYNGRGNYGFKLPESHDMDWWDDIVINEIVNSQLTETEAAILMEQLGFTSYFADWKSKYKPNTD